MKSFSRQIMLLKNSKLNFIFKKIIKFNHNNVLNKLYCNSSYLERKLKKNSDFEDILIKSKEVNVNRIYDSYQNLNSFQKTLMAIGSSVGALIDPYRDDLVAISSETFFEEYALQKIHQKMLNDEEGKKILMDKPRINSFKINLDYLKSLPENTLGYQYVKFLEDNNITCDSRKPVKYVNNSDYAYVLQRYREIHDFTHLLYGMKISILGEVVIKWIEAIQTEIPMCVGAAILGPIRLYPQQKELFKKFYLDWAIETGKNSKFLMNVYFEKRFEQDIDDLRKELKIELLKIEK